MTTLKQKLAQQQALLGTFLKTPHYHTSEVLSRAGLDVLCLDAEHAPYSRADLDANILACRANQQDVLIRVPNDHHDTLLNALDLGATGVVVPHVKSASQLNQIIQHCFYGDKGRGYAGSTRAAGYTTQSIQENLSINRQQTVVIAQLEDLAALDDIDKIMAVDGCDCYFIGRMDLTVALGETDPKAPAVMAAVSDIVAAAKRANKTTGMFIADMSELGMWLAQGVSLFLLNSDHGFMLAGAKALKQNFEQANKPS